MSAPGTLKVLCVWQNSGPLLPLQHVLLWSALFSISCVFLVLSPKAVGSSLAPLLLILRNPVFYHIPLDLSFVSLFLSCPSQFFMQQPDDQKQELDLYPSLLKASLPLHAESEFLWRHQMIWPAYLAVFSLTGLSNRPPVITWAWGVLIGFSVCPVCLWSSSPESFMASSLPESSLLSKCFPVHTYFLDSAHRSHLLLLCLPRVGKLITQVDFSIWGNKT